MTNKYGDISPRTAAYAVPRLLERGQHMMATERFGQKDPQPKNSTRTRKYRRYEPLARSSAPISEGISPAGRALTYTDVEVTLEQLADVVKFTDVVKDTHEDPILKVLMELVGEQVGESVEEYRLNILKGGTNVVYSGSGITSRATVNAAPDRGMFRRVVRGFKRNKARLITSIIKASAMVATEPVAPAYFALGHTDLASDMRAITGFVPVEKYADSSKAVEGEIGKVEDVRIILTGMVDPWLAAGASGTTYLSGGVAVTSSTACDVYPVLVFARDAYAICPLQGMDAVVPAVHNPAPVIGDEAGQIGFVSWKKWEGCVILQQTWMARCECAATANPA